MSECVHAVKVRDISKGKRIAILGKYLIGSVFMQYLSFFYFGKILQFCEVRRYICSLFILCEDRHTGLWHLSLLKTFGKCHCLSMFNHKLLHFGVIRFTVEINPKIRNGVVLYLNYAWICFVVQELLFYIGLLHYVINSTLFSLIPYAIYIHHAWWKLHVDQWYGQYKTQLIWCTEEVQATL